MAQLVIIRHAKAVDRMEAEDDFERGLTERGREDAARTADVIHEAGLTADRALISPARRTRETWAAISPVMGDPPVDDPMALYHASDTMLERLTLEAFDTGAERIVIVGHNPGVGTFAHTLAGLAGDAGALPQGWPTSAAAGFTLQPRSGGFDAVKRIFLFNPKA